MRVQVLHSSAPSAEGEAVGVVLPSFLSQALIHSFIHSFIGYARTHTPPTRSVRDPLSGPPGPTSGPSHMHIRTLAQALITSSLPSVCHRHRRRLAAHAAAIRDQPSSSRVDTSSAPFAGSRPGKNTTCDPGLHNRQCAIPFRPATRGWTN